MFLQLKAYTATCFDESKKELYNIKVQNKCLYFTDGQWKNTCMGRYSYKTKTGEYVYSNGDTDFYISKFIHGKFSLTANDVEYGSSTDNCVLNNK